MKMKKKFAEYQITFVCRGITSLLARKQKLQEFLQFLQICAQNQEMTQVLTQAKRFEDLKVDHVGSELPSLQPVETAIRPLTKLALRPVDAEGADPAYPTLTLGNGETTSPVQQ